MILSGPETSQAEQEVAPFYVALIYNFCRTRQVILCRWNTSAAAVRGIIDNN